MLCYNINQNYSKESSVLFLFMKIAVDCFTLAAYIAPLLYTCTCDFCKLKMSLSLSPLFSLSLSLSFLLLSSLPPSLPLSLSRCCLSWSPDRYVRCSYHWSPSTQPQAWRERSRWDLQWRGRGVSHHYREIVNYFIIFCVSIVNC